MNLDEATEAARRAEVAAAEAEHHCTGDELVARLARHLANERRHNGTLMARVEDLRGKYNRLARLLNQQELAS